MRKFTFKEKVTLTWGKARRFIYHAAFPGYVNRQRSRRRGECARCGACCKLLFRCPSLKGPDGETTCTIHMRRSYNCRIFPVNERDLKDRDIVSPETRCGFHFVSGNGEAETRLPPIRETEGEIPVESKREAVTVNSSSRP